MDLGDQHSVEAGQPLGIDLGREFLGNFDLALVPQLQRHQPMAASIALALMAPIPGIVSRRFAASSDQLGAGNSCPKVLIQQPVPRGDPSRLRASLDDELTIPSPLWRDLGKGILLRFLQSSYGTLDCAKFRRGEPAG
jgi:hypothetical protein